MTLVSGRPISFVIDLYQPLYLQRPVVVPEMFASLVPRMYDQNLAFDNNRVVERDEAGWGELNREQKKVEWRVWWRRDRWHGLRRTQGRSEW